jgi:Ulp1 family protease
LFESRHVLLPYCGGGHWFLVVVDTHLRKIYVMDSMQSSHDIMCGLVRRFLIEYEIEVKNKTGSAVAPWQVASPPSPCPTQDNCVDCGIYTVINMLKISLTSCGMPFDFGAADMVALRWYMAHTIVEGRFQLDNWKVR